jgi:hypothetical protein
LLRPSSRKKRNVWGLKMATFSPIAHLALASEDR